VLLATLLSAGCGKQEEPPRAAPAVLVTVTVAQARDVDIVEQSIGTVESLQNATIGAEVDGRVTGVPVNAGDAVKQGQVLAVIDAADLELRRRAAYAEVERVKALLVEQGLTVERNRQLLEKKFISDSVLDASIAQQTALREQQAGAEAQLSLAGRDLAKTSIVAPYAGRIGERIIAPGDYVKAGDPLFRLVSAEGLRVRLPFPESAMSRLEVGQPVTMTSPIAPDKPFEGRIEELRPTIGEMNRAVDAFVRLDSTSPWPAGASVNGRVVIDRRSNSVTVPELSVVVRPAGMVVYTIRDGKAAQNVVTVGVSRDGWVEILGGIKAGQQVIVDGAGFLSDGAAVNVKTAVAKTP
jgi:RND family efflux transporter MFP subunit